MSEVKPREWHIFDGSTDKQRICGPDIAYAEVIHVIEFSAYQKAIAALKSICGNRCAHQNPCEAKETLICLGEI